VPSPPSPPDRHVHTEWSWDAPHGDMLATCARAVELGLRAIAFTEHADFTAWVGGQAMTPSPEGASAGGSTKDASPAGAPGGQRRWQWDVGGRLPSRSWPVRVAAGTRGGHLDITGYWEAIERCRAAHPGLRIESGIELGEPHLFAEQAASLLDHRPLDRVLGSLHCIEMDGELVDVSVPEMLAADRAPAQFRRYLEASLRLVESPIPFTILAHLDYPKRYWPHSELAFDEHDFEEEYRAVLMALARSGRILEINSGRGMGAPRGPSPGPLPLRWWYQAGGKAVSFGSDAHSPEHVGSGLANASALAEAAGFRPASDPLEPWGRA